MSGGSSAQALPSPWDPSVPGAGAERARELLRLYLRMVNVGDAAVLVGDALLLVFGAEGASMEELESYTGLQPARLHAAVEGIPRALRCTSRDVSVGAGAEAGHGTAGAGAAKRSRPAEDDAAAKGELRYLINYRSGIPFAFAHLMRILLALSATPIPPSLRTGPSNGAWSSSARRAAPASSTGIQCPSCRGWFDTQDCHRTLSRCPRCSEDVVRTTLMRAKHHFEALRQRSGRSIVQLAPDVASSPVLTQPVAAGGSADPAPGRRPSGATTAARVPQAPHDGAPATSHAVTESSPLQPVTACAIGKDPFLVQQGLYFLFLVSTPFVCVTDDHFVTDADVMMTREEYAHRTKHKATLMEQFRMLHPNPQQVRVRLVSQAQVDAETIRENELKVLKRAQLPPWLRPATLLLLGVGSSSPNDAVLDNGTEGSAQGSGLDVVPAVPSTALESSDGLRSFSAPDRRAPRVSKVPVAPRRCAGGGGGGGVGPHADVMLKLAQVVSREFFDDDYDEVPLRR